ncbi:MAG: hypothetical protein IJW36_01680 [Clostridia bacterium]|nr:hypothetical protein [Clostridia bacterium]
MGLLIKKCELRKKILVYLAKNNSTIATEYNILIPETLVAMSSETFDAWLSVHASKIFLAKNVKSCIELKEMIKEYLLLDIEMEQTLYPIVSL